MKKAFAYLKNYPSILIIVCMFLTVTEVHLNLTRQKQLNVITWDVLGYYSYLPATFIEKDLKLNFITAENTQKFKGTKYAYTDDKKGNHILKYSMGMAILYAPFFFTAHILAQPLGFKADGYSEIYHLFIEYSGLFYLVFGFWFLRKLLLLYYSENVTAISIFCIFFGTNLLCYATIDAAMSHTYTFSVFSALLYFTVRYYRSEAIKYAIIMAVLSGLIILIRPLNGLLLFIIPLFNEDIRKVNGIKFLVGKWKHVLVFLLFLVLMLIPQLVYWKYVTGNYFVFSYGKEGFYFSQPHLFDCLFGFRKGWLVYSPIIVFALAGIFFVKKQTVGNFYFAYLLILPLYIYMVSSWWCWWYGGSFGLRPMIDLYPLLTISLAACLVKLNNLFGFKKYFSFGILFLLVLLNIYQTFQYKYNIIHFDSMTSKAYLNVFGKMTRADTDTTLLQHPDYEKAVLGLRN